MFDVFLEMHVLTGLLKNTVKSLVNPGVGSFSQVKKYYLEILIMFIGT